MREKPFYVKPPLAVRADDDAVWQFVAKAQHCVRVDVRRDTLTRDRQALRPRRVAACYLQMLRLAKRNVVYAKVVNLGADGNRKPSRRAEIRERAKTKILGKAFAAEIVRLARLLAVDPKRNLAVFRLRDGVYVELPREIRHVLEHQHLCGAFSAMPGNKLDPAAPSASKRKRARPLAASSAD